MLLKYVYFVSVCVSVTSPGKLVQEKAGEGLEKAQRRAIGMSEVLEKKTLGKVL